MTNLNGLPEQFNGFVSAFRLQPGRIILPHFLSLLNTEAINLQQRAKLHSPDPNLALAATTNRPSPNTYRNPNYKGKNPRPYYPPSTTSQPHHKPNTQNRTSSVECQLCKKLGHTATTCRFRYRPPSSSSSSSSSSSNPKTAYTSTYQTQPPPYPPPATYPSPTTYTPPYTPDPWLLDSGASTDITFTFLIPTPATTPSSSATGANYPSPIPAITPSPLRTVISISPNSSMSPLSNTIFFQFLI